MRPGMKVVASGVLILSIALLSSCVIARVETADTPKHKAVEVGEAGCDRELARLLVKLELRTRGVIAGHYVKADEDHRKWMAENLLLPAAVADNVFHEVVPDVTGGRAWVKMVVDEPRNENNKGDATALALLQQIQKGKCCAEQSTREACYYAEPIKAAKTCLLCHGAPRGEPDPFFPQYKKNGWREDEIIGAVVARVGTRSGS